MAISFVASQVLCKLSTTTTTWDGHMVYGFWPIGGNFVLGMCGTVTSLPSPHTEPVVVEVWDPMSPRLSTMTI